MLNQQNLIDGAVQGAVTLGYQEESDRCVDITFQVKRRSWLIV